MDKRKLIIQIDLSEKEYEMYEVLSSNNSVLHIFFAQAMKALRKQLYVNYHSYRSVIRDIKKG